MQKFADITVIAATKTLAAKINDKWYAPNENGTFMFEILEDKINYPTTVWLRNDLVLLIDTHGISAIVEQAVDNNADLVIGCCDSVGKINAAHYLASKGVIVYCQTDRFVHQLIGQNIPVLGSAPVHNNQIGNQSVIIETGEKIVIENTNLNTDTRYYDTPFSYIKSLEYYSGLKLEKYIVNVTETGQSFKIIEKAREVNANLIAVRIYNQEDYAPVREWLLENPVNRAILLHSIAYPSAVMLFDEFPGQTSFGDIKVIGIAS